MKIDIEQKIIRPQKPAANINATPAAAGGGVPSNFDVAISMAGPDKQYALKLAEQLRSAGFAVFYYEFYPEGHAIGVKSCNVANPLPHKII